MILKEGQYEEIDNTDPKIKNKLNEFRKKLKEKGDDKEYEIVKMVRDIRFKNNTCIVAEFIHKPCGSHFHLSHSDFYPNDSKNAACRCPLCTKNTEYTFDILKSICEFNNYELIEIMQVNTNKIRTKTDSIKIKCKDCGNEEIYKLKYFTECKPLCKCKKIKYTQDNMNPNGYDVFKESNGVYTQLEPFKSHNTPIHFHCNKCGAIFKRCLYELKRGDGCTSFICKYNKRLENELNNEYTISENNIFIPLNGKDEILLKHHCIDGNCRDVHYNRCNKVFQDKFCYYCYKHTNKLKPISKMINEVNNRYPNNEYTFLGFEKDEEDYLKHGNKTYIFIRHNCEKCGNSINRKQIGAFLATKGDKCYKCSLMKKESNACKKITDALNKNFILCEKEYKFLDCININQLPFDFKINNTLIEYDGEQHWTGWYGNDDDRDKIQFNDNIKTKYCIDNNLTLIRIPYTLENDLDDIIQSILDGLYLEDTRLFIIQNGKLHNKPEIYNYLLEESDK